MILFWFVHLTGIAIMAIGIWKARTAEVFDWVAFDRAVLTVVLGVVVFAASAYLV